MNQSDVAGFPCPKCNEPENPDKRIKTSLAMLMAGRRAQCTFCGLNLSMVMDKKGAEVLDLAGKLNEELKAIQR